MSNVHDHAGKDEQAHEHIYDHEHGEAADGPGGRYAGLSHGIGGHQHAPAVKTQLLSFILAAKVLGRHWPLIAGIFAATVANHFVAAYLGGWVAAHVEPDVMRWVLGVGFLGFAAWALIPDKLDQADKALRFGLFATTLVTFFLAEMGDKTQLATVALGAKYARMHSDRSRRSAGASAGASRSHRGLAPQHDLAGRGFVGRRWFSVSSQFACVQKILLGYQLRRSGKGGNSGATRHRPSPWRRFPAVPG
jgi:hypothetical protein